MITTPASIALRYARIPGVRVYDVHSLDDGWCHYVILDAKGVPRVAIPNEDWYEAEPAWRTINLPYAFVDQVDADGEPWGVLDRDYVLDWVRAYPNHNLDRDTLIREHLMQIKEMP